MKGIPEMASSSLVMNRPRKLCITPLMLLQYYYFRFIIISFKSSSATQLAPALFVFGDSILDVGNNNYIPSSPYTNKGDFPHYGVDFPTHKPTGRFSNGKNTADFLAENLGVKSSPPYLSLVHAKNNNFSSGVNFASGGAGVFDNTNKNDSISFNKQIEDYETVLKNIVQQLGQAKAKKLLSKSIFAIHIGGNDIFGYFGSSSSSQMRKGTPQQYVASMLLALEGQLKKIYDFGGRKFLMFGTIAAGCCPSQRVKIKEERCNEEENFWILKYNRGIQSILQQYRTQLKDFHYSYFDAYAALLNLIQQPATYGFKEVKAACCGSGKLNAEGSCKPKSFYCSNRSDHVFWDSYHPTEAASRIIAKFSFDGPKKYVFPVNLKQLVSV